MSETHAMDALVDGKTDSELLEIVVYALTANDNELLDRLMNANSYGNNKPNAAIIDAVCRHVRNRLTVGVEDRPIMVEFASEDSDA